MRFDTSLVKLIGLIWRIYVPLYSRTDIRKAIDLETAIVASLKTRINADSAIIGALEMSLLRSEILQQLLVEAPDDELHEESY